MESEVQKTESEVVRTKSEENKINSDLVGGG